MSFMGRPAKTPQPEYGRHLASLRTAAGLSQQQVAEAVNVRQSTVATWERASRPPKGDILPQLATILKVSISDLLQCDSEAKPQKKKHRGPTSRVEKLMDQVAKLPRRKQQKIADVVEALIAQEAS